MSIFTAFEELNTLKIITKPNLYNSPDEILEEVQESKDKIGFVYWNIYDEQSRIFRGAFYIGYGTRDSYDEDACKQLGITICSILKKHNVKHSWNRDPGQRILVIEGGN